MPPFVSVDRLWHWAPRDGSWGLHTGECEVIGEKVGGIAVHIGARVAALAPSGGGARLSYGEGSRRGLGLAFEERGAHALKGMPGDGRLYAVTLAA